LISPANRRYLRLNANSDEKAYGIENEGFRGMGIKEGNEYHFTTQARQVEGNPVELSIEVVNGRGEVIGSTLLKPEGKSWKEYSSNFNAAVNELEAKMNIWIKGKRAIDLDMASLLSKDTWKARPVGSRKDMIQLLADMKPGFFRFPGGCIVEGRTLDERFQWKKTIGPIEERELIVNRWNTEFKHRLTPDYYQSFGLGFYEYFLVSEDIGAEPLPILNCGMACQFNTGEVVPLDQLDPYIQDALDLIEFANGSPETTWGK